MIIGFVNDKDISHILAMMPRKARYIFTNANSPRSVPAAGLAQLAEATGLNGEIIPNVAQAYQHALNTSSATDTIFVGGSTFVVADLLEHLANNKQ